MCKKRKGCGRNIDSCMRKLIEFINSHPSVKTMASCCGHGKYNMAIVIKYKETIDDKTTWKVQELLSGVKLPRKTKYYRKDKQGHYYIPEVMKNNAKN